MRHLLETAVLEANSRLAPDEDHADAQADPADAAMTETFRSFAPDDATSS